MLAAKATKQFNQNPGIGLTKRSPAPAFEGNGAGEEWPGIDSRFRLIVLAALRSKQLLHGATPRIEADKLRRRNTSIALEEVKRGLVGFNASIGDNAKNDELALVNV